jgi:coenzyme PQQ precursor peptide PqqA
MLPELNSGFKYRVLFFTNQETTMQWTTPSFVDLRFGFEITMYIANR